MLRLLLIGFTALFLTPSASEEEIQFTPIEKIFPIHWKASIGNVSFRENLLLTPNEIIIGSNGEQYKDYSLSDPQSGVYKINRKNGKIVQRFGNEMIGDMDVNGLLELNQKLYYTNDNEELICASMDGKIIWIKPVSGDVEHEPVLLYHQGKPMIVYATESGEVRAVEPEKGKTIWTYYAPGFYGWKPTDNRYVFKVKAFFSNTGFFFIKPIQCDLNRDGTEDLLYLTLSGTLYAINGSNGSLLWKNDKLTIYAIQAAPSAKGSDGFWAVGAPKADHYTGSDLIKIKPNGQYQLIHHFNAYYSTGLNLCKNGNELLLNNREYLYTISKNMITDSTPRAVTVPRKHFWLDTMEQFNIYDSDMLFGNQSFFYKKYGQCIVNLVQYDLRGYSNGFIEIIALKDKQIVERLKLPGRSEMQPRIEDFNKDGSPDLLINCSDGNLYCYDLSRPKI
ncbi:MAG: PQQ-binding-like beta-propeller repeat protein [Bacteroidetes bacterium]|nr:PQQ-binding-like beta-propeller repeat protein [Bacteroidota bacterium]